MEKILMLTSSIKYPVEKVKAFDNSRTDLAISKQIKEGTLKK